MLRFDSVALLFLIHATTAVLRPEQLDINIFRCMRGHSLSCPNPDIEFILHTPKFPIGRIVDVMKPKTFINFRPYEETVFILHGYNGSAHEKYIRYLKDSYLSRRFNVIAVNWRRLAYYPCYLSALRNIKLVAQCTAQVYAHLTHIGSHKTQITCVGHSLGAHTCGMISNHLTARQYKIIGLDPARPLIEQYANSGYRLTKDDADVVQVIHTDSGKLGQQSLSGSLDLCINGGSQQPFCRRGLLIEKSICNHMLAVCYLANAILKKKLFPYKSCNQGCAGNGIVPLLGIKRYSVRPQQFASLPKLMHIGQDTPETMTGAYCVRVDFPKNCPFDDYD